MTAYNIFSCKHHILHLHVGGFDRQILNEASACTSAKENNRLTLVITGKG